MIWSKNKWTIISALAAVLAVIVPVVIFISSRDSKELTVKTVSHAVVVDISEPALASLKLTYNDVAVTRLTIVTIEVSNSGSRSIERVDFERDLVLRFMNSVPILAAKVAEKVPEELRPELNAGSTSIAIKPLLLNPGDWFRLTIHLNGFFVEPLINARISGVASIQRKVLNETLVKDAVFKLIIGVFGVAGYFYLLGYIVSFLLGKNHSVRISIWETSLFALILILIGGSLIAIAILQIELSQKVKDWVLVGIIVISSPLYFVSMRRGDCTAMKLQKRHDTKRPKSLSN